MTGAADSQKAEDDSGSASWSPAYLLTLKRRKQPAGYSAHSLSLWDVYSRWVRGQLSGSSRRVSGGIEPDQLWASEREMWGHPLEGREQLFYERLLRGCAGADT